ncbi:MAG: lysylphosphatidylglycerol synthase domain-containing protein, partial [Thermoleophilia bacterium]|nr:lysylphosphatidylglycerol synthase domain-containing protein [Thermoleophilia bacterium]
MTPAGQGQGEQLNAGGISRRRVLVGLAMGIPISAAFLYLATRSLDLTQVRGALGSADPLLLALAALLLVPVYLAQAARWRRIARREAQAPLPVFLEFVVAGVAVNNV